MSTTFMTGATGFVGRYLLHGLLAAGEEVVLLVRGQDKEDGRRRVSRALTWLGDGEPERLNKQVTVCVGQLDALALGLAPADRDLVLSRCDQFLHCGASVRFDLPLEAARAVNVGGTEALLALAMERQQRSGLRRFDFVSTAYVAGNRTDLVLESELDGRSGHKNTYEQTKFEAEARVRRAQAELPVSIFRPSIVVGDSEQGRTSALTGLSWGLKVYGSGLWRTIPGRPDASIDLVPVNFVSNAILRIRQYPESLGRCFHLAAGAKRALPLSQLVGMLHEFFPHRKPARFINPDWWKSYVHPVIKRLSFGSARWVIRTGEFYAPYFVANPLFDNTNALEVLSGTGIEIPEIGAYVHRLIEYAVATNGGSRLWSNAPPRPPLAK